MADTACDTGRWRQRSKNGWLTQEALRQAYRGIIVSPDILAQIGPAVNSATSVMFDTQYDGRWARCRRPFIVAGGELSIDMLEKFLRISKLGMSFGHAGRFYPEAL